MEKKVTALILIGGLVAYFIGSYFMVSLLGLSFLHSDLGANLVFIFFSTILGFISLWAVIVIGSYLKKFFENFSTKYEIKGGF